MRASIIFIYITITIFINARASNTNADIIFTEYDKGNYSQALIGLEELARLGDTKAEARLARMYGLGLGVEVDYPKAYTLGIKSAKAGNPLGQNVVGVLYFNGWGVKQNTEEALKWWRLSADAGFNLAQQNMGAAYLNGIGVVQSDLEAYLWYSKASISPNPTARYMAGYLAEKLGYQEKALEYLKLAANDKHGEAMAKLGKIYLEGRIVVKDVIKAIEWYQKALKNTPEKPIEILQTLSGIYQFEGNSSDSARLGKSNDNGIRLASITALEILGKLYLSKANPTNIDYRNAFDYYYRAAEMGSNLAQSMLGLMFARGIGTEVDMIAATNWNARANQSNDLHVLTSLGDAYRTGDRVVLDMEMAQYWYEHASRLEDGYAKFQLAFLHSNLGNQKKAFDYLLSSAALGYADAMASLGDYYYHGTFVEKNFIEAMEWYTKSLKYRTKYKPYVKRMLAVMHFYGQGIPKNTVEGLRLYHESANLKYPGALQELGKIYKNGISTEPDTSKALHLFEQAVELGDAAAALEIGRMYYKGDQIIQDKTKAYSYFKEAEKKGNISASLYLISLDHEKYLITKQDTQSIEIVLKKAASQEIKYSELKARLLNSKILNKIQTTDYPKSILDIDIYDPRFDTEDPLKSNDHYWQTLRDLHQELIKIISQDEKIGIEDDYQEWAKLIRLALELEMNNNVKNQSLFEEIDRIYNQLISKKPPEHPLNTLATSLRLRYLNTLRTLNQTTPKEYLQILRLYSQEVVIVNLTFGENLTRDNLCRRVVEYMTEFSFHIQVLSNSLSSDERREFVQYLVNFFRNYNSCYDLETFKKAVHSSFNILDIFGDSPNLQLALHEVAWQDYTGQILNFMSSRKDLEKEALIALWEGNYRKQEILLKEIYSLKRTGRPSSNLIRYYHRDGDQKSLDFILNEQLRQTLQSSVARDFIYKEVKVFSKDLFLLQRIPVQQRIFLMKLLIDRAKGEYDKSLERWGTNRFLRLEIDRDAIDVERNLISLLYSQNRTNEAEFFVKFLKTAEIREIVRGSLLDDLNLSHMVLYNDKERHLLKTFADFLARCQYLYSQVYDLKARSRDDTISTADDCADKFYTFLTTGYAVYKNMSTGPSIAKNSRISAYPIIKLDPNTVLLRYILDKNLITISMVSGKKKWTRKLNLVDGNLDLMIYRLRLAIKNREPVLSISKEVYDLLFRSVDAELKSLNAKHILLSLDGRLRYVPFEALHDGTNYLLEKYAFSIHDDLIMRKEKFIQSRFDRIAGFGVSVSIGGFAALPAVNDELRKIIQNSSGGIFPGKIVLNKDFTADVFQRSIKEGYPAIHVATHFRFSPGNEFRSFLLLGDGARLYLEAFKDIDLQSVDLITFSACETGLGGGKDEKGREIVGLTYVSQLRGARSVIASLWAVSDLSTSELMARIYRHIGSGRESKASALRKAKLELFRSDSFQHPFHWAGFQLYGQWH